MSFEIGKIELSPDDVLVIKVKGESITDAEKEQMVKKAKTIFWEDIRVLIYCEDEIELFIIESKKIIV